MFPASRCTEEEVVDMLFWSTTVVAKLESDYTFRRYDVAAVDAFQPSVGFSATPDVPLADAAKVSGEGGVGGAPRGVFMSDCIAVCVSARP